MLVEISTPQQVPCPNRFDDIQKRSRCMNTKTFLRLVAVTAFFVISVGRFCPAQSTSQAPKQLLFRGRPLPVCKSFLIYEVGVMGRLNSPSSFEVYQRDKVAATLDAGLMWNRSATHAIGGIGHLSIDGGSVRVSALFRYRRWLMGRPFASGSSPLRVDLDAGIVVMTLDPGILSQKSLNFSSGIGLNFEDLLVVTMRYETYRTKESTYHDYINLPHEEKILPPQTNGTFFLGVKGCSYIGGATSIVFGGIVAFLAIMMSGAD